MFNRQPFNNGKFNALGTESTSVSGIALMRLGTSPTEATRLVSAGGTAALLMRSAGVFVLVKYNSASGSLNLTEKATGTKNFYMESKSAQMILSSSVAGKVAGESFITLGGGLELLPGDELVIDTCNKTVSINGINAMEFFADDSDFFELLSGDNEIIYSDTSGARSVALDIIWKDRWL